jgi:tetratricopeptide (TPR) repeat protein
MLNDYRYNVGQFSVNLCEFSFAGEDVKDFLQTQSTFDIHKIHDSSFQLITFLDPQGRVESYGWLVRWEDYFSYLVPPKLLDKTIDRLNRFLISEDVSISDGLEAPFVFLVGPEGSALAKNSKSGVLFGEPAYLVHEFVPGVPVVSESELKTWRGLTGWPSFSGEDYKFELLTNQRLFDLSLSPNKGCYPGQETVSKIATRRGAAYSPVLLELTTPSTSGEMISFDKKIGTAHLCHQWNGVYYLETDLLRDFRVEGMKIHFSIHDQDYEGIVRYYPLLSGDSPSKAQELFYQATEDFKSDNLEAAEKNFLLAIKMDPSYADAYESLGVMLGRLERYQEAIELMKSLSQVDPKSVLAHTNMSLYLMKLGKITEAEDQKSQATIKSFQSFGDEAKRKELEISQKEKQILEWSQREKMFKEVLEIDPDDTLANYGIGSISVEKGEWSIAKVHLERVLVQDPKYSVAYLALGKALKGLGQIQEAKKIWEEGIKVSASKGDLMPANQMQQELISL